MEDMKFCNICGISDGLEPFIKNRNQCKKCNAEKSKQWRKANPEKARNANRRWKQKHPERVKELSVKWAKDNQDKIKAEKARNHLRRKYKLTNEAFTALLESQDNRCKICNVEFNFLIKALSLTLTIIIYVVPRGTLVENVQERYYVKIVTVQSAC